MCTSKIVLSDYVSMLILFELAFWIQGRSANEFYQFGNEF